jgi:Potassium voltage-gated channel
MGFEGIFVSSSRGRKSGNQSSDTLRMTKAVLAQTAQNASNPAGLPFTNLLSAAVGIKGVTSAVTAVFSPAVGVGAEKIESGSPVDGTPVGVAVMLMGLRKKPNPTQESRKSVHIPSPCVSIAPRTGKKNGGLKGQCPEG